MRLAIWLTAALITACYVKVLPFVYCTAKNKLEDRVQIGLYLSGS